MNEYLILAQAVTSEGIDTNTAIQALLGILIMICGAILSWTVAQIDKRPTHRETDAKFDVFSAELVHGNAEMQEHKKITAHQFNEVKDSVKDLSDKANERFEKLTEKLDDIKDAINKR